MSKVNNKVVIVTGAGGGIGQATSELMAKEGAQVVVTDINIEAAENTVNDIVAAGGKAVACKHDVASEADWQRVIAFTLENFNKLDVLVNNAGIVVFGDLKDASMDDWRKISGANLDSVFLGTRDAINAMLENKTKGSIINIASVAGLIADGGPVIYNATKGGVRMLSKAAADECKRNGYNIRVNSVYPGAIDTPARHGHMTQNMVDKLDRDGDLGRAIDIAKGILYLASDDANFITGSELVIDGGVSSSLMHLNWSDLTAEA